MPSTMFLALVPPTSAFGGMRPPTEEQIRSILMESVGFGPSDSLKVVPAETFRVPRNDQAYMQLRERLEIDDDVRLLVVSVQPEVLPPAQSRRRGCGRPDCPVCGPGGLLDILALMFAAGPPPSRDELGCGDPNCPTHGPAVRAAMARGSYEDPCVNCPAYDLCRGG
jgi:hypothetical protein